MKMIKLYSPDGTTSVEAHPSSAESMKNAGWTAEPVKKTAAKKPSKAAAPVEEPIESAPSEDSEKE